ncbi:hypothetical protein [Euzebya tangerina]|uniref:hypothetical protein n=1 Tax=Euzebya tangerina TaxID=591198 RepID=UPI000E324701|nr:hypothetical protein [Euzebya tangerina]
MDRRQFIRTATLAATTGLVATACGGAADGERAELPPSSDDQAYFVQLASLELLTGPERWLAFGLTNSDMSPLAEDQEVDIYLRRVATTPDETGEVIAGPLTPTFSPAVDTGQGVYYLQTALEEPGLFEIVALTESGFGVNAIQVVDPSNSQVRSPDEGEPLIPGAMAVSAQTATVEEDLGVFSLCTQDPPCGMHEVSLDEALAAGQPVVMMFATPQFCQTAVCGPSVATLETIREEEDWGDVAFIHSEIYAEEPTGGAVAGVPVVPAVADWGLPTEPWLFTIGADGVIVDRLDGPMPVEILRDLVGNLTA